ncbi:MAG: hypothetical protein ACRCVV_21920 [Shewanella sp.]
MTSIKKGDRIICITDKAPLIGDLTKDATYEVLEVELGLCASMEPMVAILDDKNQRTLLYLYEGFRFIKHPNNQ